MSQPFVPGRIVGGSVIAEHVPPYLGGAHHPRGVEVLEVVQLPERAALSEPLGPYRTPHPGQPLATRWVEVLEAWELSYDEDDGVLDVFERTVAQLHALAGPGPRILHAFGRDGRVRAVILERLEGAALDRILGDLRERGEPMPIAVALAIARELASLWQRSGSTTLYLEPGDVRISPQGRVRARPELPSERARQVVGAAVAVIPAPLAYVAPEVIMDSAVEQSGMHTLGLVLRELLGGEPPTTPGESPWAMIQRILREPLPPIEQRLPGLPPHVAAFANRAVAKDPQDRFESWRALVRGLSAIAAGFDPVGPRELAAWLRSLPMELQAAGEPAPEVDDLGAWRQLPHSGWAAVPVPERAIATPSAERVSTFVDPRLVYAGRDQRPMYASGELHVDARPVTAAEHERFGIATGLPWGDAIGDQPRTLITYEQAEAYARWAGKRLPTDEEWTAVVRELGAETLGVGEVWEWTSTPRRGGHVVRGGRWRDAWERPPAPENRSHETAMAVDVGFRCVMDRER